MGYILMELQLLPPISYFILSGNNLLIDDEEKFQKQTFRNRFSICGANGIQTLTIPIKKGKTLLSYREVQIDYSQDWQRNHYQAIISAYNNSPWFLHYKEEFVNAYMKLTPNLFDFNFSLLELIYKWLKFDVSLIKLLSKSTNLEFINMKNLIQPNITFPVKPAPYQQVFQEKNGYIENLSILDLIFNQGPRALNYLNK